MQAQTWLVPLEGDLAERFGPRKLLVGGGKQKFADQYGTASGSYFAFAPGGTLDYRLNYRWDVRADYEYQFWPSAPGLPGFDDNGMNPHGFSLGIGYRLFTAR